MDQGDTAIFVGLAVIVFVLLVFVAILRFIFVDPITKRLDRLVDLTEYNGKLLKGLVDVELIIEQNTAVNAENSKRTVDNLAIALQHQKAPEGTPQP